ncbi:MAG: MMPL family transporter [Deltaproteobacteria bacterium]|nr:MMPL family transporter [Deltaproteobacteria bacterium]
MTHGQKVIKYRWIILALTLLVVSGAGYGMKFLGFETDGRVFFSPENPQLKALEAFERTYNRQDNIIYAIEPKNGDVFTAKTLLAISELTEASWQIPYSSRVDSITNYQHTVVDQDDLVVGDLVPDPASLTSRELEEIKKITLNEPTLVNRIISPDGKMAIVMTTILKPEDGSKDADVNIEVNDYIKKEVENFKATHPELDIYLTGSVPFDLAFTEVSQNDMRRLMPVMFVIIIVFMYLFLGSVAGTIATITVALLSIIVALGLSGWYGLKITSPSAMAPTIILTLAIADSIHILTTIFYEMRRGMPKAKAIVEGVRVNMLPVFLTSITTAIGFLSMNSSDAPPFRDLGNVAATGVMAAFFFSIFLLPALIYIFPIRVKAHVSTKPPLSERLGEFVVRQKRVLLISSVVIIIGMMAGMIGLELDDNFKEYFDERYPIRTETDYVSEKFMGMDVIEISLPAGEASGINEPLYLERLEKLANYIKTRDGVSHVNGVNDIIKRLNVTMNNGDVEFYKIPKNRELIAQYLLLYEMSLPFGLDLNTSISVDRSSTRLTAMLRGLSAVDMRALESDILGWMKTNVPEIYSHPTGMSLMFSHISERNIRSMLGGGAVALILISIILVIALRSVKIGIISLVPNLIPAFMAFGLWGYLFDTVGLAVAIVSVISLGIVVDDTVHFLSKYLRARREHGMNPESAVKYTFNVVGRAIITTTMAISAGFLVLTLSGFKLNLSMGLLTAFSVAFALLVDFFFLPPLLMRIDAGSRSSKKI